MANFLEPYLFPLSLTGSPFYARIQKMNAQNTDAPSLDQWLLPFTALDGSHSYLKAIFKTQQHFQGHKMPAFSA
jgi:hypothetical protein